MNKINVFFLLPQFVLGGAGKSISTLCKNLDKKKFNIFIICLNNCYYSKELKKYCDFIYEIKVKKIIFAQREIKKILNKKKHEKSILISNLFYCNALVALFQKKNELLKFIFVERTPFQELSIYFNFIDFIKKMIIKFLLKIVYKKADLIIANSNKTAKDLSDFYGLKTKGIYPPSFSRKNFNKKFKYKNKVFDLLTVGRLSREKGFNTLIEALSNIKSKNFRLLIIGDGPEKDNLKRQVKEKKLNKQIIFLGAKKDVDQYFKKSDLFINSSLFEGFPNVVVEALSFGIPVICSNSYGGIGEILNNGKYGYIFKNNDITDLTTKIEFFFKNPKILRRKAILGQKDLNRFSIVANKDKYEKIFLNI